MRNILVFIGAAVFFCSCGSGKAVVGATRTSITTTIDLVNVVDDKVRVSLDPGAIKKDEITFFIPKTVPGTYSEDNYGKYIEDLKAYDYNGKELAVSKSDENTWKISGAQNLDKISYLVNDTYDTEGEHQEPVFSPSGTNILKGENFMLNLHGFYRIF